MVALAWVLAGAANSAWQDTPEARLAELLQRFESAREADLPSLVAEIDALGFAVLEPAVRRLALDLRDGVASLATPALVDVLASRRADLGPLRDAFAGADTPPSGRVQLARALAELDDAESWRPGLREILADPDLLLDDRLAAAAVLLEAGDPAALEPLGELVAGLPSRPPAERRRLLDFLSRADTPETRALLEEALTASDPDPVDVDEPLERLVDQPAPRGSRFAPRPDPKKSVVAAARWTTMVEVAAVAAALVLLVLCWLLQRKG